MSKNLTAWLLIILINSVFSSASIADTLSGYLTGDEAFDVYLATDDNVEGTYLGTGSNWLTTYTLTLDLTTGQDYYFHIRGRNTLGIAGFIGSFTLSGTDHVFPNNQKTINTNTSNWKVSKTGWGNYTAASVVNGNNGVLPWLTRPYISSSAKWIWSSSSLTDQVVYFSIKISSLTPKKTLIGSVAIDDEFQVYLSTNDNVRGTLIASGNDWRNTYSLSNLLGNEERYYLHVYAKNYSYEAGFLGQFFITGDNYIFDNNQNNILTNTENWRVSNSGWGNYLINAVSLGNNGVDPWGGRTAIANSATWIWSSPNINRVNADSSAYFSTTIHNLSFVPGPVDNSYAFYRFEESSWRDVDSVIDAKNNSHGTPIGSIKPLLPVDTQKSCQVMDIPYNSSIFYTDALDTNIDVDSGIGKAGTISFWYRSKLNWSSSFSRQLLDASNGFLFGKYFFLTLTRGTLQFGMEDSVGHDRFLTVANLNFAAFEWVHVAISWDMTSDKMALFVNGNIVASTSNAGFNGQMANLNTLYVGDSRDLYFAGNSSDNSAYGQFDDLRIYNYAQTATEVKIDLNTLTPCLTDPIDHFRIEHDTQGFTCEAETVVIKACIDASCSELYDQPTSITLSPGTWAGGNTINFSGSTTAQLRISTVGTYTLNKTASSENGHLRCFYGSNETCDIKFVDAGFEFIGATKNDKTLIDQKAETYFSHVNLRSVKDQNGVCKSALTGNHTITFGYDCVAPDVCLTPFAGIPINDATGENSGNITVNFNSEGVASLAGLLYADAGRLALSAKATIANANIIEGRGLVDIYPASLKVNVSPLSLIYVDASDSDKYTAGANFEFQIAAFGDAGSILPNYQPEYLQLKIQRLSPSAVNAVEGNFKYSASGELSSSPESEAFLDVVKLNFSGGVYTYPNAYYDETGKIGVDVQDVSYLGNLISSQGELTLGLFIPAYYDVEKQMPAPALNDVQSNFTYIGQTNDFAANPVFKITAKNAFDRTTANYDSSEWLLRPALYDVNDESKLGYIDKTSYQGTPSVFKGNEPILTGDDNYDGSVFMELSGATITYPKVNEFNLMYEPIEPFSALFDIVFYATFLTDSDGICYRDNVDDQSCNDLVFDDISGAHLRFGRFAFKNAYGPENDSLSPEFSVEHYIDGRWLTNINDSFTAINFSQARNELLLSKKDEKTDDSFVKAFTAISSDGILVFGVPDSHEDFYFTAPGRRGDVILRLNPDTDTDGWAEYLNYDWNNDGYICNKLTECSVTGLDYPQAIIRFGSFRGNDKVIQWREIFN